MVARRNRMPEVSHAPSQGMLSDAAGHPRRSQLAGLVLWVCGTILAGSACQNAVAAALSTKGNWRGRESIGLSQRRKERGRHHRHRHQRGLPGLRDSRGLAHPARQQTWGLDGPDSGTAAGPGPGGPRRHDRDCAVRPGTGQSEIVETDTRSGLASLHEVSEKRHFLR